MSDNRGSTGSIVNRAKRRLARLIAPDDSNGETKQDGPGPAAKSHRKETTSKASPKAPVVEVKSTKEYDKNRKNDYKRQMLDQAMKGMKSWRLSGDYLEFGVYRGRSFIHAIKAAEKRVSGMHFYAFDSFQGLPQFTEEESAYKHFEPGQYSCSEEEFRDILRREGVDLDCVTIVPGFYDQSLTPELQQRLPIRRAAIVWIDCDLYESTVPVLDFVTPFIDNGSFLIFDDWFSFGMDPMAGEYRATREWLERNPQFKLVEYRNFGTSGAAFLVQKWPEGVK